MLEKKIEIWNAPFEHTLTFFVFVIVHILMINCKIQYFFHIYIIKINFDYLVPNCPPGWAIRNQIIKIDFIIEI